MDAPTEAFSAARAKQVLVRILGDERPHPTGSTANAAVRDRIVAEFARLGIDAEVQRRFACGGSACATVDNVVAKLAGASAEDAVLLSAHYDSVAAGPGASDDGAGVAAIIEVARALQAGPPLPRDVWLLANDGEELGLIGAEAFAREPEFKHIRSAVNLEARGTTGASLLIETQPGNAAIVSTVRRALSRPGSSSLDYEIYKTLPNDTDFTVYRREGLVGVNFAWARGAARYHTPLDDIAHLDPGSLQQHGDNALAMARALASTTVPLKSSHDAVFFNVFGAALAGWPVTWNVWLLVLGLAAWLALAVRLVRREAVRVLPLIGAGAGMFAGLALLGGIGWAIHSLMQALGAMPAAWTAQGGILVATFVLLALPVTVLAGWLLQRWCGEATTAAASLLPFAAIAIATVMAMPGASHMGLLPLLAGALCGHACPGRPRVWAGVAAVVAAALWFPYAVDSYSAIGHPGLPAATLLTGLVLLPLIPALRSLGRGEVVLGGAALLATIACAVLALARPAFDADVPRPMNLVYVGTDSGARVFLQPRADLPAGFLRENGFALESERVLPWSGRGFAGPDGPALTPPILELEQDAVIDGKRQLRIHLRSARGAVEGGLVLPGSVDVASIRVRGQTLAPSRWHAQETTWRKIALVGLPDEGATFEFKAAAGEPVTLYAYDRSHGVPAGLVEMVHARDAVSVPSGPGDSSWSWTELTLED
ncbi:M20/M25/M40 family metallo-hydrolase [Lysobacter sp. A286]